jgi:hypothetical protein
MNAGHAWRMPHFFEVHKPSWNVGHRTVDRRLPPKIHLPSGLRCGQCVGLAFLPRDVTSAKSGLRFSLTVGGCCALRDGGTSGWGMDDCVCNWGLSSGCGPRGLFSGSLLLLDADTEAERGRRGFCRPCLRPWRWWRVRLRPLRMELPRSDSDETEGERVRLGLLSTLPVYARTLANDDGGRWLSPPYARGRNGRSTGTSNVSCRGAAPTRRWPDAIAIHCVWCISSKSCCCWCARCCCC